MNVKEGAEAVSAIKDRKVAKIQTQYVKQQEQNIQQATRKRTLLLRRLSVFFVFAAIMTYFLVSTLISQGATLEKMKEEKALLEEEYNQLKKTETILREEIVKLNDDEYIAKLARRDYFLSEEGEIIFAVPKENKEKTSE